MMQVQLDHVLIGGADLASLTRWFEGETGIAPACGGAHEGLGTRNALVSLGIDRYLELLAVDEEQEGTSPIAKTLARLDRPTSIGWAFHCNGAACVAEQLRKAGLRVSERSMQRRTPDGGVLSWDLVFVDHSFGPVIPFLIDWRGHATPAATAPGGVHLERISPVHPDPASAQSLLREMQIPATVAAGARSGVLLELSTPRGELRVGP